MSFLYDCDTDMANSSQDIITKAMELSRLDRECKEYSYETRKPRNEEEFVEYISELMGICARAFKLKNEVQLLLAEVSNLTIHDPEIEKLLRDVRGDKEMYSISQYKRYATLFNRDTDDINEMWEADAKDFILNHQEALDQFHCEVDYVSYFAGTMKIGTLISRRNVPEPGLAYFREIRESFAFGLFRSSIALCRALLETAFFETLKRNGYFKPGQSNVVKIDLARDDNLFRLIKEAFKLRLIDYDTKEDAFFVKNRSNTMVLHPKDEEHEITEDLAFDVIGKTVQIVEQLYEK